MHPKTQVFSAEIPVGNEEAMKEFNEMMDALYDATMASIKQLALELDVSEKCASDVYYLRTRSRWTEELEKELIALHKKGTPPNIFEWPKRGNK